MTGVAAVEITGITKRFDDVVAIDNMDLTIADGEFLPSSGRRAAARQPPFA